MDNEIWYEVFVDRGDEEGTQTLQSCNTLEEARQIKADILKAGIYIKVYIDKWTMKDVPTILEQVE
jgi:hypothetical protein